MGRRRSPYLTKTKAGKNKGNRNASSTDHTSLDNFYTTESNDTQTRYDYSNNYKNYEDYFTSDMYDSRLFDTYSPKRKDSGESYTIDDYTTSGVSYSQLQKSPKDLNFSMSDRRYKSPEKYNKISSVRDYDQGSRSRENKRFRLMQDSDKSNYHETLDESEQYVDRDRKYRSPRSRYYQDLIHEEPEKEFDYDKYFEKARTKVGNPPKQRRLDKYDDERYEKQQKRIPNKRKDYQVYAYQDPKHHEQVFKGKNYPGDLSPSSEVEIKTHEYPVLAFRDAKSGNKESDMVYLPIIVLDKKSGKSRPEKSPEEPNYQANQDNFQIYAANLQEQHNIFQNFGGLPTNTASKEPTSREKQHAPHDFGTGATSGMRYAGSLLGAIIDDAVDTDFKNEDAINEIPFSTGKTPFTYQVDVDILPTEPKGSLKDKNRKSSHLKNGSINDPLHDGYPVTKDYIKVSSSEQKRNSQLSKEPDKPSSVTGHKSSEEKKSNTEDTKNAASVKVIDDQTITMSIAQSRASPVKKSIMRNPSQVSLDDQPPDKKFSLNRQSVAVRSKQNSRASHTGPAEKANTREKLTPTKLSVLKEESKTGSAQRHSVVRSSKAVSSGFAENTTDAETRRHSHGTERKSMKPDLHREQTEDRLSQVQTTPRMPSPLASDHQKSVLYSHPGTVAHMAVTPPPSSHNILASHAQSRKSTMEDRRSKIQMPPSTSRLPVSDQRKSVVHSQGQDRKSTVAQMADTHSPPSQNMRASQAQSRKSAVAAAERSQKSVPESLGKKTLAQSSPHHVTHISAENTAKRSHKGEKEDDSAEALREFTKDVFQVDLAHEGKTPSHKSEQKNPSVLNEKLIVSVVHPSHGVESRNQSRKSAVGHKPLNAPDQSQNVVGNTEPAHEQIGDNSAGVGKKPTDEVKKKTGSLMRTTSKVFTALSKIGKKKSTEATPYITTGSPTGSKKLEGNEKPATPTQDDSHFVRSIEPTVTQYKKEQNKTQTITKSKSKSDTKLPKEKKSLTRMLSRSKSKESKESGEDSKKKKKKKGRSLLGILKRSKSSESAGAAGRSPEEAEGAAGADKEAAECECFTHYVKNTRVCAYFFLGTTLHEQIMNIINIFLGGK